MSLFKDKIELELEEAEFEAQKRLEDLPLAIRWLFIVSLILIIPAYFIARSISVRYWQGKYKQYEISAKPSFTNPAQPTVSKISLTTTGAGNFAAIASIKNENLDLSLENAPYTFSFFNDKKELVYTARGTFFLLPNQSTYITVPKITTSEKITAANLELPQAPAWQKRIDIPVVKLIASQPNSSNQIQPPAFVVEGDVVNDSPYNLGKIHLTFILKDFSQTIVGVSQGDEFTLKPFERRAYKQLWPNISGNNIVDVEVFAETDTLDTTNLILPDQPITPASDLSR